MHDEYRKTETLTTRKGFFQCQDSPKFSESFLPDYVQCQDGMRILDAGCGTGDDLHRISQLFPQCTLLGFDTSESMVAQASERIPSARIWIDDMETFSLPEKFDRIIVRHALHLTHNPLLAVQNLFSHLAPKGKCIFALHSDKDLPALQAWIRTICDKYTCSFSPYTVTLENSEHLFDQYPHESFLHNGNIRLTSAEPYITYLATKRTRFAPPLDATQFAELCALAEKDIEQAIQQQGVFLEPTITGIVTLTA